MTPRIILRKGRERRQFMGHPWVYEGEMATVKGQPTDGDVVDCMSWQGAFLGRGYINSRSKIRVRILTRQAAEAVDDALLRKRLVQALSYRQRLYPEATSLRLVHAEGDLLPGLTVDRYEDALVMQCASLGMDRRQDVLAGFLRELTGIEHIYLRNDISVRRNDGLELGHGFLGDPFPTAKPIRSGGLTFEADLAAGHKTGFYLDQADNHLVLRDYVPHGGAVLDAFCYSGAFALHAAAAGAETVLGLDSSEPALELARRNAEQNALRERCRFEPGNVFDTLRQLGKAGQQFDLIVLDPPSFTRNRHAVGKALSGYKEINLRALKLIRPGGRLITFTCSYYVDRGLFEGMLQDAAGSAKRHLIVRQRLSQAAHHPEVLSVPETGYLKGVVVEVG
ncbi:MAG: class I SAM-dependent rRNA methyltransferase [Candidatus Tectomicrobia bacterium]|nr:class I SAM-dependent rRNA methyltransferase [Candidatus Tectomicrobia bacterium]